jgi:biotin operon repressor
MQVNNRFQKNANISMVTQLIWRNPGISRVEIARNLKLYRSTVSNIINTLVDKGIVVEIEEGESLPQGGRKPIYLGLNEQFGCVAGIEIQPTGYRCVVLSISNTVLFSISGELPCLPFPDMVDAILSNLYPEIDRIQLPLLAVCIGMPGIIDSRNGVIVESVPFSLRNYAFCQKFFYKYKVPFYIENDANCLVWKELARSNERSLRNFVCINIDENSLEYQNGGSSGLGIGIGVAIDGSIYAGNQNASSEFIANADKGLFTEFVVELFSRFVSVVAVLKPEMVFAYGDLVKHSAEVRRIINGCVPQFNAILERTSCGFSFADSSIFSVSTGAALMYFLQLFSIPGYHFDKVASVADWDAVFARSLQGRTAAQYDTAIQCV